MAPPTPDVQQSNPLTESRNPRTVYIDRLPVQELVNTFIREDRQIISALEAVSGVIAKAVEQAVLTFRKGHRLIYIGAGTSGRLGVLDAAECPPTFGVSPDMVVAVLAGGPQAVQNAAEGAEDNHAAALEDLERINLQPGDMTVGITASGTTPYVLAGLRHAKKLGCFTCLLTCNPYGKRPDVHLIIDPVVGPEVIAGSTRLKSGTACKMVLNILSSAAMIRIGKVYENLMVDVRATNQKLRKRALQIVMDGAGVPNYQAEAALVESQGEVKTAIYIAKRGGTLAEARAALAEADGVLYRALDEESYD